MFCLCRLETVEIGNHKVRQVIRASAKEEVGGQTKKRRRKRRGGPERIIPAFRKCDTFSLSHVVKFNVLPVIRAWFQPDGLVFYQEQEGHSED